ncbi:hypothetical protein N9W00_01350 [Arcobacteraceae bacterium]|nr:hypothetical protein [Arcobacteraceae bacterium]
MTETIDKIFDSVKYWQEKRLLLQAIHPEYYQNKNIVVRLLGVTSQSISPHNEAKKDMWNHHIINGLGDDILQNVNKELLKDFNFARDAIAKYNRTYLYLDKSLQASRELALLAAQKEENLDDPQKYKDPILQHMPETFRQDHEISLMATTRNIENLKYADNLRSNKYFIIDIMNVTFDHDMKQKILRYINRDLLSDKKFVSKLGCFDNLCEKFQGDTEYVASAVLYDIKILKKTDIFDESILKAAIKNYERDNYDEYKLADIFRYIERFHTNFNELNKNIKNKKILAKLFWSFGETISSEFV